MDAFIGISLAALISFIFWKWMQGKIKSIEQNMKVEKFRPQTYERLSQLEAAGYFTHADESDLEEYKDDILTWLLQSNESLVGPSTDPEDWAKNPPASITKRDQRADGEDLAEEGIYGSVKDSRFLKALSIQPVIKDDFQAGKSYTLEVNGKTYTAYTEKQFDAEGTFWLSATACYMAIMNDLLKGNGKDERVYMLYAGGNGAITCFLTPKQYQLLQDFGKETAETEEEVLAKLDGYNPRLAPRQL